MRKKARQCLQLFVHVSKAFNITSCNLLFTKLIERIVHVYVRK